MGFQAPPQMTDTSTTSTTQQELGLYGLKTLPPLSLQVSHLPFMPHLVPPMLQVCFLSFLDNRKSLDNKI